jgi:hypothetical protein
MAEPSLPSLDVLRPDLPQRLREAVSRGLESSPDARSITADEMLMVLRESVTSNEGRNVLAELLGRAKQENDLMRSGPPPEVTGGASSSIPRAMPTPRPPPASPASKPKPASEPSITDLSRTALGIGQVPALTPTGGVRVAAPSPPSTRGALPKAPAPALRPVMQMPTPAEGVGMYRSVTAGGRPAEERVMTALGVAPPPPHVLHDSSIPPALAGSAAASSLPPIFGTNRNEDALPSALAAASPPPPSAAPASQPPDPAMRAPTPPPPPPPAAIWAALLQSEQQAISIVPPAPPSPAQVAPIAAPPPPLPQQVAAPPAVAPLPRRAFTPIPEIDRGSLREIPIGTGSRGTYTLIAGILFVASAAVVAALLFAHRSPEASSSPAPSSLAPTASATATPTPTATATPTPTPTATATATASLPTATPPPTRPTAAYEGTIVTPAKSGGHRVFVDGRYAGDSPGPIKVRCGTHTVKIGSGGVAHPVDVPCGSEIMVTSH